MASAFVSSPAEVVLVDSRTRQGTITLPLTNSIPFRVLNFKDQYGTFSNSTLTLSTQVGESFDDGTTSKVFSNAFGAAALYATSSKWMVLNATTTVQQTISSLTVNQLTFGTGAGWVQFGPVQATVLSTIQVQAQTGFFGDMNLGMTSTVTTLDYYGLFGSYNNTVLAEISTGAGTQELLVFKGSSASDRVRVQTTGAFVVETGVSARLWNSNTTQTLSNTTPAFIINTSSNVGIQTASPGATLDVAGTGRFQILSTLTFNVSSINGQAYWAPEVSTVTGLGSSRYLSSIPSLMSTAGILASSITTSSIITSSLQVNSLIIGTGTGWVNLGPIQAVAVSSLQENTNALYATSAYIGNLSTLNTLQYNGLFGNYNNSVVAEVSTGAGTQELLFFKGSSTSDRFRFQTTGAFVVETGVSSRLFNSNTTQTLSNATPAMVITTASNVGIQTASPQATLDVAGAGRFQAVSTLSLQISSINGSVYTPGGGGGGGGGAISYLSAFTVSTADIVTSTLSSYAIFTYGVIGTNFFNTSFTETMNVTSLTDLNTYSALSTITNANAIYQSSSNDIRFVAPSNVYFDTPQVVTSNLFCYEAVSTYSLVVYGPSTLTVQGLSYFENTVSSYGIVTDSLAIVDTVTQQPQFIQVTNGVFDFGGSAVLDQNVLTSTVIGLGTVGYISTQSGGGGGGGPIAVLSSPTKIGSDFSLSQLGFYGLDGDFNTAVVGHQQTGVGTSELILFKGSSINDSIRLATMGDIRFEPQRAVTTFPTVPALATPTMILQSNLVGIATASPGTELDVAGTGRFVEVSTITVRANVVYTNTLNIAIQTV